MTWSTTAWDDTSMNAVSSPLTLPQCTLLIPYKCLLFSFPSDLKKTTVVVESLSNITTKCTVPEKYQLTSRQGSMICVVDRHETLCDVTFSDHIVHPTCTVHGLQLQYWHSFSIYHISQTIQHRYRWYCLLHILEHFCHFKFQFSFFVYVMIKL